IIHRKRIQQRVDHTLRTQVAQQTQRMNRPKCIGWLAKQRLAIRRQLKERRHRCIAKPENLLGQLLAWPKPGAPQLSNLINRIKINRHCRLLSTYARWPAAAQLYKQAGSRGTLLHLNRPGAARQKFCNRPKAAPVLPGWPIIAQRTSVRGRPIALMASKTI